MPESSYLQSSPATGKRTWERCHPDTAAATHDAVPYSMPSLQPTYSQLEVIEGVFVDGIQFGNEGKGKLHHGADVHVLPLGLLGRQTAHSVG